MLKWAILLGQSEHYINSILNENVMSLKSIHTESYNYISQLLTIFPLSLLETEACITTFQYIIATGTDPDSFKNKEDCVAIYNLLQYHLQIYLYLSLIGSKPINGHQDAFVITGNFSGDFWSQKARDFLSAINKHRTRFPESLLKRRHVKFNPLHLFSN